MYIFQHQKPQLNLIVVGIRGLLRDHLIIILFSPVLFRKSEGTVQGDLYEESRLCWYQISRSRQSGTFWEEIQKMLGHADGYYEGIVKDGQIHLFYKGGKTVILS